MATFLPPPANAPIGFWRDQSGRMVQVFPSRELSKFFESNFGSGEVSSATNITEETSGGASAAAVAELSKRIEGIESDQAPNLAPALAELSKRADDLEADQAPLLLAQIAEMSKRIADLETELAGALNLNARVAQLAARINEIEIEAM